MVLCNDVISKLENNFTIFVVSTQIISTYSLILVIGNWFVYNHYTWCDRDHKPVWDRKVQGKIPGLFYVS